MHFASIFALLCLGIVCQLGGCAGKASLTLDLSPDGSYRVLVNGQPWLVSGQTALHVNGNWKSTKDGSLKLVSHNTFDGIDGVGPFRGQLYTWQTNDNPAVPFKTLFREYRGTSAITFEQIFPDGASKTSVQNKNAVVSIFPSFQLVDNKDFDRGFVEYGEDFIGEGQYGQWPADVSKTVTDGILGGPMILFTRDLSISTIISPFSQFFASSFYRDAAANELQYGIMGNATSIPKAFSTVTVLYLGSGINSLVLEWGDLLLRRYGKDRHGYRHDFTLTHLGYYTDNGAYYYYHTEDGKNYEETLIGVKQYADQNNIPYRYILLDSWWYFKGPTNGVKNWTAMPSIFPHGLDYFHQQTGWPVVGHNRYWSFDTDYATQNGGQYKFIIENTKEEARAVPQERNFWDYLLYTAAKWGLAVYEQDWLDTETDGVHALTEDVLLGRDWLMEMGSAAANHDLFIQYCMPHMRHTLQSVEIPAVTQIRASGDYHPDNSQWQIGVSSLLAHAIGLAPSKDNFWTTPDQPNNPYNLREDYPELEAAIATFSTGPVAPSDKIGYSNVELIMRSCMKDGFLLQPSKPGTAIDPTFVQRAFGSGGVQGELYASHTEIQGIRWHHITAAEINAAYSLTTSVLEITTKYVAYEHLFKNATIQYNLFDATNPIKVPTCGRKDFHLYHAAPVFTSGWTLIGELEKWVPVSEARFRALQLSDHNLYVSLRGTPDETVTVTFLDKNLQPFVITCAIGQSGTAEIALPDKRCTSN